ncbi:Hypothetical predicted protein, partial [Mytilus galloprovincialis]
DLRHSSDKLEILHNNEWGTVCSSNFNKIEAEVACMQLGYRNGSVLENTIATGTSKIWLNILACDGNESKLMDCPHSDWDTDTCSHGNVVGIRCSEGQDNLEEDHKEEHVLDNEEDIEEVTEEDHVVDHEKDHMEDIEEEQKVFQSALDKLSDEGKRERFLIFFH